MYRGGRFNRGGNSCSSRGTNPRDQYGNVLSCHICGSLDHFAYDCPQSTKFTTGTEKVTLFQKSKDQEKYGQQTMEKFTSDNFCLAVLDTSCNTTVCGKEWSRVYLECLDDQEYKEVKGEQTTAYRVM